MRFQKGLEKEISRLKAHGDVEKKFCELNVELKQAKDYLRKLQVKEHDDQKIMQNHHEQIILLEDKARKLAA
jgi:predicted phage tail protein